MFRSKRTTDAKIVSEWRAVDADENRYLGRNERSRLCKIYRMKIKVKLQFFVVFVSADIFCDAIGTKAVAEQTFSSKFLESSLIQWLVWTSIMFDFKIQLIYI